MMHQQLTSQQVESLPANLSSPHSKLVYLYLEVTGETTLDELAGALSMQKIDVLSVVRSLADDDLIECDGTHYQCCT